MERERLSSRLGFILLSAGCAIGIGNVWKFPYMVGQNGGGIFVLLYLFFLLVMGIPVMTIEFSLGRASQKSPVRIYQTLAPKGSKWYVHGYVAMAGNYLLMMFYTVVAGWMIQYFFATASGRFNGLDTQQVEEVYHQICANPVGMVGFTAIVVVLGFFICSFSLQKGVERVSKYMMLALLAIMVILAINSFTMDGAREGLSFYLKPDLEKMREVGIGNVIVGAMTQAFFTLSLGMGSMAIFDAPTEELVSGACTISGPAGLVEAYLAGREILTSHALGGLKSVTFQGALTDPLPVGLEQGRVSLQDYFISLQEAEDQKGNGREEERHAS